MSQKAIPTKSQNILYFYFHNKFEVNKQAPCYVQGYFNPKALQRTSPQTQFSVYSVAAGDINV